MGFENKPFAEILEEKLQYKKSAQSSVQSQFAFEIPSLSTFLNFKRPKILPNGLGYKDVNLGKASSSVQGHKPLWSPVGLPQVICDAYIFFHEQGEIQLTDKSTRLELKKAFRRLAKKLHPDRHMNSVNLKVQHGLFIKLQEAHSTLAVFLRA